jgi:methionine synthase I (cobalamin-dependent)
MVAGGSSIISLNTAEAHTIALQELEIQIKRAELETHAATLRNKAAEHEKIVAETERTKNIRENISGSIIL